MKKFIQNQKLAFIVLLFGAVWFVSCLCFADFSLILPNYVIGILFGLAAFGIVEVYLLVFHKAAAQSTTEISAVPLVVSVIYLIVVVMFNTNCIFRGQFIPSRFVLIGNCLAIAIYIAVLMNACDYSARCSKKVEEVQEKISTFNDISKKIGLILNHAEDQEIRKSLLNLKESVDYSSNLSQNSTAVFEEQFYDQLDRIEQLLSKQDDLASVKNEIKKAEKIWMDRNSAANMKR